MLKSMTFFFSSRRRHTRLTCDWSSDVCSSDLDRIDSQILTHYPQSVETAMHITTQEAWLDRINKAQIDIPDYMHSLVEQIAFVARQSELVDQSSGVSARLTIAAMELLQSNLERRAAMTGDAYVFP